MAAGPCRHAALHSTIAWLVRLGLLLAVGVMAGAFFWSPQRWALLAALAVPGALAFALALVLALEVLSARTIARRAAAEVPPWRRLLRAWWVELGATCRLLSWRIPVSSSRQFKMPTPALLRVRGVVLVHGYGCNRGVWSAWLAQLEKQAVPCIAVNLEPIFASISDHIPTIESAVVELQGHTGLAPVLVGHSMGGLVARAWWAQQAHGFRVHRLITIASPHQGTLMARFGIGRSAQQMRPQSDWLQALRAQETPALRQRTLCFYSDCDSVVVPSAAAVLPGSAHHLLPGCAHVALLDHPAIFAAVLHCARSTGSA